METGVVREWRARWRDGSGERGWGARGWEDDRIAGDCLTILCDERGAADLREQVEAGVRGRRERRGGCAPIGEVGREQPLPERDRLRFGPAACVARSDSRLDGRTRDAEQRELQGAVGEPGEEQVAGAEHHGRKL